MIFEGKAILITGASTGIGKDAALSLARLGCRVFAGVRNDPAARVLEAEDTTHNIIPVQLDVIKPADIEAALLSIKENLGEKGLYGLINNAGIAVAGPLGFLPIEKIRTQLEVNVIGQLAITQAFLPLLIQGKGRIINVGSVSGRNAYPFFGAYGMSKFALEAMSDALRLELRPWGIPVTIIQPGSVQTPIWEKSMPVAMEMANNFPEWAQKVYEPLLERFRGIEKRSSEGGLRVEAITELIVKIMNSSNPKARYLIATRGAAFTVLLLQYLPTPIRDYLIARNLEIGTK